MAITYHNGNKITADGNYHFKVYPGRRHAIGITGTWDSAECLVGWQDSANESTAVYPALVEAPNPLTTNGGMEILALGDCVTIFVSNAGGNCDLTIRLTQLT